MSEMSQTKLNPQNVFFDIFKQEKAEILQFTLKKILDAVGKIKQTRTMPLTITKLFLSVQYTSQHTFTVSKRTDTHLHTMEQHLFETFYVDLCFNLTPFVLCCLRELICYCVKFRWAI